MLCPTFFIKVFAELFTKSDRFSFYLRPSLLGGFLNRNRNRNSHTDHGVVAQVIYTYKLVLIRLDLYVSVPCHNCYIAMVRRKLS